MCSRRSLLLPRAEKLSTIERQRGSDFNVNASLNGPALEMNQQPEFCATLDGVRQDLAVWAAAGFKDTLLRWKMKPEVVHGEKKDIQPRVQARGGQAGH
jgi:hypothetical protein